MAVSGKADAPYSSRRTKSSSSRVSTRFAWAMVRLFGATKTLCRKLMIRGAYWAQRRRQAGCFLQRFSRVAKSGTCGSLRVGRFFVRVFLSPNEGTLQAVRKMHTLARICEERIWSTRKSRPVTGNCERVAWVAHLVHDIRYRSLSVRQFLLDQFVMAC